MPEHPYGWLSLLPPTLAIVLAIATRRVLLSLASGVFVGALITSQWQPWEAFGNTLELHLWKSLVNEDLLRVFVFTLLMGAMVGVINRAAGMRGLVDRLSLWATNRQRGQLMTWALGLVIFFDDYANTLLLGNTLRPLCDRLKISREKLAFLVDSTAAPVSGLALVSTWVAGEISYVQQGVSQIIGGTGSGDSEYKAFELFVNSIPYRFYVLWALVFVFIIAWLGRDFGPMLAAERRTLRGDDGPNLKSGGPIDPTLPDESTPARWYNAVVPIAATVGAIVWLLYQSGLANLALEADEPVRSMMNIFGAADSYSSLLWGALFGLVVTLVMVSAQRLLSGNEMMAAADAGARVMIPALAILWLASSLSKITGNEAPDGYVAPAAQTAGDLASADEQPNPFPNAAHQLYTGQYLSSVIGDRVPLWLLPTCVFVLSGAVAFSTGTSWGTMGIVMPLVIPLVHSMLTASGGASPDAPILLGSIGSVLAGAIFGDHCSPISDTTVLSSQSSGCDHMAHVWTQLPYALTVGATAILLGTLPIGLGISPWVMLPIGVATLVGVVLVAGRRAEVA